MGAHIVCCALDDPNGEIIELEERYQIQSVVEQNQVNVDAEEDTIVPSIARGTKGSKGSKDVQHYFRQRGQGVEGVQGVQPESELSAKYEDGLETCADLAATSSATLASKTSLNTCASGNGASSRCEVILHIYDLRSWLWPVNELVKSRGFGMFHAGVEVWGEECTYGKNGVEWHAPRKHPGSYRYRESQPMGCTKVNASQWRRIRCRLQNQWAASKYHLLDQNCIQFVRTVCEELGVADNFPEWINGMATQLKMSPWGEAIDKTIKQQQEQQRAERIMERKLRRPSTPRRVKQRLLEAKASEAGHAGAHQKPESIAIDQGESLLKVTEL